MLTSSALLSSARPIAILLSAGLLALDLAAQTSAANQPLDLKEGIWQLTVTSYMAPNQGDIDKVLQNTPPEQRARTRASLNAAYAKGTVSKRTVSLKPDNPIRGTVLTPDGDCPKEMTSSISRLEVHFKCAQVDIVSKVQRIDSENFTGSIHETVTDTPPRIVNQTIVGKWTGEIPQKAAAQKPAGDQLMTARINRMGNDYYSVVGNHSGSAMTAYAISITMYGSSQKIRHFYDARMLGRAPIKPGAANQERIAGIVLNARPLVAVFADGSTFGDPREVADLMNRRTAKLTALVEVASILCNAEQKGAGQQSAIAALEASNTRVSNTGKPMLASIQAAVFSEALEKLKRAAPSRPISISEVLNGIPAVGMPLLEDPVKDPGGSPYIQITAAQFSCGSSR